MSATSGQLPRPREVKAARPDPRVNPFKGPFPLEPRDRIFGRDNELEQVLSLLVARRLVLLHAVSGCGKSSLLEAGLRGSLERRGLHGRPTVKLSLATTLPRRNDRNPLTAAVVSSLFGAEAPADAGGGLGTELTVANACEALATASPAPNKSFDCYMFDQFEQALTTTSISEPERIAFFKQLGLALEYGDRWAIFAIRDDYLGALEPYLRYLPTQLSARFRLSPLSRTMAADALVKLTAPTNVEFSSDAATALARELDTGDGMIEPVYLQVVGQYLWNRTSDAGKAVTLEADAITQESLPTHSQTVGASGNPVELALRQYYDDTVAGLVRDGVSASATDTAASLSTGAREKVAEEHERRIRKWFGTELIEFTPRGKQRRQALWTESSALTAAELQRVQDRYLIRQDRRQGIWVELAHDTLVGPILLSNADFQSRFKQTWQTRADNWDVSGRDRVLLLDSERQIDDAERWANSSRNTDLVRDYDRDYIALSRSELHNRRKIRWLSIAGAVIALILLSMSAWTVRYANEQRRHAVSAQADADRAVREAWIRREAAQAAESKAEASRLDATRAREDADRAVTESEKAKADARLARDRANAAIDERTALIRKTDESLTQAQLATATAISAGAQAAKRTEQARAEEEKANRNADAMRTASQTHELNAKSLHDASFGDVVAALGKLATGVWTPNAAPQQSRALTETVASIQVLFSRGLHLRSHETRGFVQTLAVRASDGELRYITQDGEICALDKCAEPSAMAASPSGDQLASAPTNTGTRTGARKAIAFKFPTASAAAQDLGTVAIGTARGEVQIFSASGGLRRAPFKDHRHEISALALSPSGRYLAASTSLWSFSVRDLDAWPDNRNAPQRVYRVPRGGLLGWFRWINIFAGETTRVVKSLAVFESPDPTREALVATGRQDGAVAIYRLRRPTRIMNVPGPFDIDDDKSDTAELMARHTKPVIALAFSSRGEWLASGGQDGKILLWTVPPTDAKGTSPGYRFGGVCKGYAESLAFSPDDSILAAGCQDGSILLIDPRAGKPEVTARPPLEVLRGQVGDVRNLVFDPERRRLYATGAQARIEEWYIPTGVERKQRADLSQQVEELRKLLQGRRPEDELPVRELEALRKHFEAVRVPGTVDKWDENYRRLR